jgi:hypothetical protein
MAQGAGCNGAMVQRPEEMYYVLYAKVDLEERREDRNEVKIPQSGKGKLKLLNVQSRIFCDSLRNRRELKTSRQKD